MSVLFAKILQQAEKTFLTINKESLRYNLQLLKNLVELLQLKDLQIDPAFVSKEEFEQKKAPCSFIQIRETPNYTMSVFILRQQYTMPLHDHPQMLGLLKVISGRVKVQSYSKLPGNGSEIIVKQEEPQFLDASSKASVLDENVFNYHEITALDDEPAAFFDVLSPPYSSADGPDSRHCHFYKKLMVDTNDKQVLKLEKIDCPDHYYCDSLYYDCPKEFLEFK